jgi:hypothetical protein
MARIQFTNLGTVTFNVAVTATHNVDVKLQIPSRVQSGSDSAVLTLIQHNGTTVYTGIAGATGAWAQVPCTAGDTLSVTTSSSNAIDNNLNAIQGTVVISDGPGY